MIHHNSDLFYDLYNTINENNHHKLTTFHHFQINFLSDLKSSFITSSASSLIMISMLSLFECIICSPSSSLEQVKLIAIVN